MKLSRIDARLAAIRNVTALVRSMDLEQLFADMFTEENEDELTAAQNWIALRIKGMSAGD